MFSIIASILSLKWLFENWPLVLFIIVVLILLIRSANRRRTARIAARQKAMRQQQAAARPAGSGANMPASAAVDSGSITFRVAGTTFDNDDGSSRQEILRHLKFGDAPWANDQDDLTATLEETEYDGQQAITVFINDYQVGFVPKTSIRQVAAARKHVATCYVSDVRILGGGADSEGRPLSYGCEITVEY